MTIEIKTPRGRLRGSRDFDGLDAYLSKAQVMALAAGEQLAWSGCQFLLFGPPGGGKSHLAAALGLALVQNGRRVLFIRTGGTRAAADVANLI